MLVAAVQLIAPDSGATWIGLQLAGLAVGTLVLRRAGAGWWLVAAARAAGALGTLYWVVRLSAGGPAPNSTALGLSTAAQYALYAMAAVRLTRRRRPGNAAETGFEAGAVAVAVAMLAWCFVVEPYLGKPGYAQVGTGLAILYAVFDLAILAGVLRSLMRPGPGRLVGAAGGALLASHLLYAGLGASGPAQFLPGGVAFLLVQLWGVLLTAAALHPGAARLGAPAGGAPAPVNRTKLAAILLTAVVSPFLPVLATVGSGRHADPGQLVPAILVASLCGLLIGRIWLLVRVGRRRAERLRAALDELEYRAGHDSLTGLANRDLFLERLPAAGAVLLVGLDGFKTVNDAHGHAVGDEVLIRLAERFAECAGDGDLAARLGGDEFGFVVAGGEAAATALGERLLREIAEPIVAGDLRIHLTAGAGVAGGAALADAELALQAAKHGGGNRVARYDAGVRAEQTERQQIAEGLRRALADEALRLEYQPVVDTATGVLIGVEALMRWDRPDRPISPGQFIPVAEQTGLIGALGDFALRTACREASRWYHRHGVYVTVNVSTHQLRDPGFADTVLAVLDATGLPPAALVLEITESVLIDADAAEEHLRTLRRHGVRIAIDDFGTGYSSLAYLHLLPVDILKIDRTFISRHQDPPLPRDVEFTRAILEIARTQGLTAVAEGVETAAQAGLLRDLNCPLSQGYYFSRPAVPAAIDELLAHQPVVA